MFITSQGNAQDRDGSARRGRCTEGCWDYPVEDSAALNASFAADEWCPFIATCSPVRRKVLKPPAMEMVTPRPSSRLPQLLCCSFSFLPISSLRSCEKLVKESVAKAS